MNAQPMPLPGLTMPGWQGIWVPKGTPEPVIAKLQTAIVRDWSVC